MREEFQADLNEISRLLVTMAEAVRAAMRKATTALLTADLKAAEAVIERDAEVDAIYGQVEARWPTPSHGRRRSPATCAW